MNIFFFSNEEIDKLLEASIREVDPDKSFELFKKMQILLAEQTPVIPLWLMNHTIAKRTYVHGEGTFPIPISDTLHLRDAWIDK